MKLTDSDIISAAREVRDEQNEHLHVAPNPLRRSSNRPTPLWWAATAAALLIGYVAGVNVPGTDEPAPFFSQGNGDQTGSGQIAMIAPSQGEGGGELGTGASEPAIVREVIHEVVHDTIYQTRIVRVPVPQAMTAQAQPAPVSEPLPESPGCSMLCDDIRYDLLAGN